MKSSRFSSTHSLLLYLSLVVGLLLYWQGCAPTPPVQDGGPPERRAPEPSTTDRAPADRKGPQQFDLSERLKAGQVRVGYIRDKKEFIGGPNAQEKIGDLKIYNDKVAFTLATKRFTNGYLNYGGKVVAADIVRPPGEAGQSMFQEFSLAFQHRMMKPETIEIVNDGSDGKDAVVRITGKDQELKLLLSYIKAVSNTIAEKARPLGFQIVYEYRLAPGSEVLQLKATIKNVSKEYQEVNYAEVGLFMGDGLKNFFPQRGFLDKSAVGAWKYHGLSGEKVGYVLYPKAGEEFQVLLKYKTVVLGLQDIFDLDRGQSLTRTWHLAVGRDLAAAQAIYRRSLPKHSAGVLTGKLLQGSKPLAFAPIHIEQSDGGKSKYIGQAYSQADGSYTIELPPGTYALRSEFAGALSPAQEVSISADAKSPPRLDLKAPATGTLTLTVKSDKGVFLPSKVTAYRLDKKADAIPAHFAPQGYSNGAAALRYLHKGAGALELPPGRYKIVASRGLFYELAEQEVEIKAGESLEFDAVLKLSVPLPKYISGDFHIHAKGSTDSEDTNELKVAAMAGEGLGLAVSTDHEFVTDYQPTIEKLGLATWIRAVIGEEVTTFYGHFNTFPIPFKPQEVNQGAFQWYLREAPAMFDFVAQKAPNAIIQINHPRGLPPGSYFTYAGYDPATGKASRKEAWSWKFHAIEVVNGNGFGGALTQELPDWYSMLNRGRKITAMGNSDSHHALTSEVGYPRNLLRTGSDDPKALTMEKLAKTIKSQAVVVSGGPMIHLSASDPKTPDKRVELGQMLSFRGGKVQLHIRVEASTWIHVDKLQILVNGAELQAKTLEQKPGEVVRFDQTVEIDVAKDSWVSVMVTGSKKLPHVAPGSRPFAFTNPIYLDANDDKTFTPPAQ